MSIEQVLRKRFGDRVRRSRGRNGLEYKVCCPYCQPPDRKYKLYINPERYGGVFNCYKCGKAGRLSSLIGEFKSGPVTYVQPPDPPLPENVEFPGATVSVAELPPDHPAITYLEKTRARPFDKEELAADYGVRYCEKGRTFGSGAKGFWYDTSNTLIFPVWMFGKLVGWQSRLLYDPDRLQEHECTALGLPKDEDGDFVLPSKYWTNPGMPKGRVMFNFDTARKFPFVVVTEGVFDSMSVGRPGAAMFGKGVTENQTRMLRTYWETVILLLDPGDADKETGDLTASLVSSVDVVPVSLQGYKDAGDAPREAIWSQIADTVRQRNLDVAAAVEQFAKERF